MKYPGFIDGNYESQSVTADCQIAMNMYLERIESGEGQNQAALYPTGGLKMFVDLSGLQVRAEFEVAGGTRAFAISGATFYEVFSSGTFVARGAVSNDSQVICYYGQTALQLAFASAGTVYVYDLQANTLTPIPAATFNGLQIARVHCLDGFFIAVAYSNQYWLSNVFDAMTWDGTQTTQVSFLTGNIVGSIVSHRELWLFGSENIVVYDDAINPSTAFPFEVNTSADIEQGIAAPNSVCLLDNTIFWLGSDARGRGVVWSARGYNPVRVSDHGVEFAIQGYGNISDAIGYSFQDQGHAFYQLYFPSANKTWVYDVATGKWHQRGYWDLNNANFTAHRSQNHMFVFGKHLVGDWKSGKVYEMAIPSYAGGVWQFADDDGNPIRRLRRAPHLSNEQKRQTYSKIQILLETGLGPIPPLPGSESPTQYRLADVNGIVWFVGCDDNGALETTLGFGLAQSLTLNDVDTNTTSWRVGIDVSGVLTATSIPYSALYPQIMKLVSDTGTQRYGIEVDVNGVLETTFIEAVSRAPQVMIQWSNDGGHSFRNEHLLNCGKAGEFQARAIARRLGMARDRVFQIAWTDPVPFRLVDAYLS